MERWNILSLLLFAYLCPGAQFFAGWWWRQHQQTSCFPWWSISYHRSWCFASNKDDTVGGRTASPVIWYSSYLFPRSLYIPGGDRRNSETSSVPLLHQSCSLTPDKPLMPDCSWLRASSCHVSFTKLCNQVSVIIQWATHHRQSFEQLKWLV